MRVIKLVRDRIPEYLIRRGGENDLRITYDPFISDDQHRELLRRKLIEEATEYLLDPCVGELADVLEVCHALAVVDLNVEQKTVERVRLEKKAERGGFTQGLGMCCGD